MRIKAWAVTGAATVLAGAALVTIATTNDPDTAGAIIKGLFWAALSLTMWGFTGTLVLLVRGNIAQGVWTGLVWTVALCGALALRRTENLGPALLGGIIIATLVASVLIWRRFRHG